MRMKHILATSLLLAVPLASRAELVSVQATLETRGHFDDRAGNFTDVDDPAIWLHPSDSGQSLVATALKEGGLDLYTLDGQLLQHLPAQPAPACSEGQNDCENNAPGRLNNVEVMYDFDLGGKPTDLVVASDRGLDTLAVFALHAADGQWLLRDVTAAGVQPIFSRDQDEINEAYTAYGLATYRQGEYTLALVSRNSTTRVAVLELADNGAGQVTYATKAMLDFPHEFDTDNGDTWTPCTDDDRDRPQFEGMVADPAHNALYLGQENVGIWRIALDAPADRSRWTLFARAKEFGVPYQREWDEQEQEYACTLQWQGDPGLGDAHLSVDIEGLTIYDAGDGHGYLLVSSQGDNTVAVYDREQDNAYLGSFRVDDGPVDGVNETDGMMVINAALGERFPQGLLVMQDGQNTPPVYDADGQPREGSNFKFVDWQSIASQLELTVDTTNRAR